MKAVTACSALAVLGAVHAAVNARLLRPLPRGAATPLRVALLVPARDEQADIAACVRTLRAQRGLPAFDVVVLDDGSTDATASLAAAAGARVIEGAALPAGWLGKPHACAQLAAAAGDVDVLVFVDADVRLAPDAVAGAVSLLQRAGLDLVSPYPRQVAVTAAERLLQPLLVWTWLTLLPLRLAERSRRASLSAANGQFLLVRRDVYERAGGHDAVRAEVLDDVALARAVRRVSGRGGFVRGRDVASCRMYRGTRAVRDGYGKSLGVSVGNSPVASLAAAAIGVAVWTVPFLAALRGSRAGWVGYAAAVVSRLISGHVGGSRTVPDALSHPVAVLATAVLTVDSVRRRPNLTWRGRAVRG